MQEAVSLADLETSNTALGIREQMPGFSLPVYVCKVVGSDMLKELVDDGMASTFWEHKVLTSLEFL